MASPDLDAMIRQAAQEQGIDPALYRSLIMAESSGNANAVSSKGAMGYAQLMPATAAELGVDPSDPAQNLKGGAMYLRQMLERFKDPKLALAAYNAGPANVEKYNGIPPFAETQNYVSKVLGGNKMENTPTQQVSNDPMGSLSKGQRLMLAFGALKDAGMALQGGQEGTSFARTMQAINEQQDQSRKARAAQSEIDRRNQASQFLTGLITPNGYSQNATPTDGQQPTVVASDGSPAPITPSDSIAQLESKKRAALAYAAQNPEFAAMLPSFVAQIDDQINKASITGTQRLDFGSLNTKTPAEIEAMRPQIAELMLSPSSQVSAYGKMLNDQYKDVKETVDAYENSRINGKARIQTIDAMLTDPDLPIILGAEGAWNEFLTKKGAGFLNPKAADLYSLYKQFEGQAFMDAYVGLKGGGSITEVETANAKAAQSRINNAQSPEDFRIALGEARQVIRDRMLKIGVDVGDTPLAPNKQKETIMPNGVIIKPRG